MHFRFPILLAVLLCFSTAHLSAQTRDTETPATPAFKDFLAQYIAAINSKDAAKYKACIHPGCASIFTDHPVMTAKNVEFRFKSSIGANPEVFLSTLPPDGPLPMSSIGAQWSVRPTHQLQINTKNADGSQNGIVAFLAMSDGKWYEVIFFTANSK